MSNKNCGVEEVLHPVLFTTCLCKAPYWAVRIGPPTDRYVDRPLPGDTALCVDDRLREKEEVREEEEGETCYRRAALPRFPHTIRRPWAILLLAGDMVLERDKHTYKHLPCKRGGPSWVAWRTASMRDRFGETYIEM
ncbi:hypothetical protein B296_00019724 [Ensete ventricosum]|uniref:Uncharacterized protein n=1 Tax=Ensete ventricosum TaxID=4639 RepID=A0A427A4E2_ENSVE|nr:hypothetical protein B296_00019724 [Ensete ventricosum]